MSVPPVLDVSADVLAAAIALTPQATLVVGQRGRVVSANVAAEELFGAGIGALVGVSTRRLFGPSELPGGRGDGVVRSATCDARRLDGETFPAEVTSRVVRVDEVRLRVLAVRDISAAHAAERRARAAEAAERGARDLHEAVLQRVFGSGLLLEGLAATAEDERVAERLRAVLVELVEVVRQLGAAAAPAPAAEGRGAPVHGSSGVLSQRVDAG